MNRRSFFTTLAKAAAGFAILPAATTYARKWVRTEALWIQNPSWVTAEYEIDFLWDPSVLHAPWGFQFAPDPFPIRYIQNEAGDFERVEPTILQRVTV